MNTTIYVTYILFAFFVWTHMKKIPFADEKWKSGYLSAGNDGDKLFYVLVQNRQNNNTAPLIIWLNGGPGCTSAYGLYQENGPVNILRDKPIHFVKNPHSWNNFADVMYVDQPAGVGLSISKSNETLCKDEYCVALGFYTAFIHFLAENQQYKGRELYFAGESYAGHYIPAIAAYFAKSGNKDILLKGVAIGNPLTRLSTQIQYYPWFLKENHIFNIFEYIIARIMTIYCLIADLVHANPLELIQVCDFQFNGLVKLINYYDIRDTKGYDDMDELIMSYLNDTEIQASLGVNVSKIEMCNMQINSIMLPDVPTSQSYNIEYLLENNYEVTLYFGDKDYICNWRGGENLANSLKWKGTDGYKKAQTNEWKSNGKIAGTYRKYANFNFVTVKDAGHMVPLDQPEFALNMIKNFVFNGFN